MAVRRVEREWTGRHRLLQRLAGRSNGDPFQRVIFSESHDEIANVKSRVSSEIDPKHPDSWAAQKRTTLAAALVLTSPGIPMLFQGQEFLEDGWFQDSVPVDWHKSKEFSGLVRMQRDLIHLRLNTDWIGYSRGFGNQACSDVVAEASGSGAARDHFPAEGIIAIGPYSVLVSSQDKPQPTHTLAIAQDNGSIVSGCHQVSNTGQSGRSLDPWR